MFSSTKYNNRLISIFHHALENHGSIEIGLQLYKEFLSPALKIGAIFQIFMIYV